MSKRLVRVFIGCLLLLGGCALKKKQEPTNTGMPDFQTITQNPLSPEETDELMQEVGGNWLYGQGVGEAALNVGAIVAFPPYAIYVLGNAALNVGGYEEMRVTDLLPDEDKRNWNETYDEVTSVPGRIVSDVSGEEFRTKQAIRERMKKYLHRPVAHTQENPQQKGSTWQ